MIALVFVIVWWWRISSRRFPEQ